MPELSRYKLSVINCEQPGHIECHIAYWMWRYVITVCISFGVVGNSLSIAVLSRKSLRKSSTCILLIFLAMSDTFTLLSGFSIRVFRNISGFDIYNYSALNCSLLDYLPFTAGTISCWLIVLVTFERTMITLFPLKARLKATPKNAFISSIVVVIVVALVQSHLLYGYTLEEIKVNTTVGNETRQTFVRACILRPGWYTDFYNGFMGIIITMTCSVVPFGLIVTGNTIIGTAMIRRRRVLQGIAHTSQASGNVISTSNFFVLCGAFIITTLPYGLFLAFLEYDREVDDHTLAKYQLLSIALESLICCNFSFNFVLYVMMGTLFRQEFRNMINEVRQFCQSRLARK